MEAGPRSRGRQSALRHKVTVMVHEPPSPLEMNPIAEAAKAASGVAAVTSPWWLVGLKAISDGAAFILPILGVIWLVIQMTDYFRRKNA